MDDGGDEGKKRRNEVESSVVLQSGWCLVLSLSLSLFEERQKTSILYYNTFGQAANERNRRLGGRGKRRVRFQNKCEAIGHKKRGRNNTFGKETSSASYSNYGGSDGIALLFLLQRQD